MCVLGAIHTELKKMIIYDKSKDESDLVFWSNKRKTLSIRINISPTFHHT